MSRRSVIIGFALTVLSWTLVLLFPTSRTVFFWYLNGIDNTLAKQQTDLESLAARHPNDPRIEALLRTADGGSEEELYKLIEKYPRQAWLIPYYFNRAPSSSFAIDDGFSTNQENSLTNEQLERALRIAERGSRLSPNNSFYDWLRAGFLMATKRTPQALAVLAQGARKTGYDNGINTEIRVRLDVMSQGEHVWEERFMEAQNPYSRTSSLFYTITRAVMLEAKKASKRGDHESALKIYRNQMLLCRTMSRNVTRKWDLYEVTQLYRIVWHFTPVKLGGATLLDVQPAVFARYLESQAKAFAAYARLHGHNDIAREAVQIATEFAHFTPSILSREPFTAETPWPILQHMAHTKYTAFVLRMSTVFSGCAWLAFSVLSWMVRRFKRFTPSKSIPRRDLLISLGWASLLLIAGICLAIYFDLQFQIFSADSSSQSNLLYAFLLTPLVGPYVLASLAIAVTILWRARRANPHPHKDNPEPLRIRWQSWHSLGLAFAACCWSSIALGVNYALYQWAFVEQSTDIVRYLALVLGLLAAAGLTWLGWRLMAIWSLRHIEWRYGFACARSTLGAMTVVSSVLFALTIFTSLPARAKADVYLDQYISKLSIPYVARKQNAALKPPPNSDLEAIFMQ